MTVTLHHPQSAVDMAADTVERIQLAEAVAEIRRLQQELIRAKAALHAWERRSNQPVVAPGDVQLRDRFTVGQLVVTLHGAPFAKAGA